MQVARRMRLAAMGHAFYIAFLSLCGLFAAALLALRLSGLMPGLLAPSPGTWLACAAVPVLAALVALMLHRKPTIPDAARLVDQSTGAKDLYLTLSLIDTSAGEYQPLVLRSAEARAAGVQPDRVLPFEWQKKYWHAVWLPALIMVGVMTLPQFDPFGKVAKANLINKRHERLAEAKKATELRLEEVRRKTEEHDDHNPVDDKIEELKLAFNKMEPTKKEENLKTLLAEQKDLGKMWRQLSAERLKDLMSESTTGDQQFGSNEDEKLEKWQQELQQGSAGGIQKEMQDLKQALQKLAQTKDPVKRSELMEQIKERVGDLEKLAEKKLHNEELASALDRVMQQLELSEQSDLSQEALESAMQSLELSQAELKELEQAVKDLKELEQALKTVQQAKKVNDEEKLDGEKAGDCKTLSDYEALYAKILAESGDPEGEGSDKEGEGMGQRGFGKGGEAPEDDSVETGFKTEQSKSAVVAGKMLLSMQQKGEAEKGDVVRDYKTLVQSVKQGAMEALNTEQIPPGYHEGIKGYFDALEKAKAAKPK
jgi:tetratricopeptide (TPR) repeat protein